MSADANSFNFIKQSKTMVIVLDMLSKYGIDINMIVAERGPINCFEANNILIQYLAKFESIDIIKHNINKEIVQMIGKTMFSCKL